MVWVKLFHSLSEAKDRLAESRPQLLEVSNVRICLVLRGDQLFAVSNKCTHNGESLSKGKVNFANEIVCPWHGYQYRPHDGQSPPPFKEKVCTYDVLVLFGKVYVNPSPYPEGTARPPAVFEPAAFQSPVNPS